MNKENNLTATQKLEITDRMLVEVLAQRMRVAKEVEESKRAKGEQIYRGGVEEERIEKIAEWARSKHVSASFPSFARSLLYFVIDESCKTQMIQLQDPAMHEAKDGDEENKYARLKENLIQLADAWAKDYDYSYDKGFFATRAYKRFEQKILEQELNLLKDRGLAVDIGCATGIVLERLAKEFHFKDVAGFDISAAMIQQAFEKFDYVREVKSNLKVLDVEDGMPLQDNDVSFALMNFGTASDIRNIKGVLSEINRTLRHDGVAFLSFYNRDALLYKMRFLPWDSCLVAGINIEKNRLEVRTPNGGVIPVYAKPYNIADVEQMMPKGMTIIRTYTFPSVASVLPSEIMEGTIQEIVYEMDEMLAEDGDTGGSYLIAIAKKTS